MKIERVQFKENVYEPGSLRNVKHVDAKDGYTFQEVPLGILVTGKKGRAVYPLAGVMRIVPCEEKGNATQK